MFVVKGYYEYAFESQHKIKRTFKTLRKALDFAHNIESVYELVTFYKVYIYDENENVIKEVISYH